MSIDIEKERVAFEAATGLKENAVLASRYGAALNVWLACAESKAAEIDRLREALEALVAALELENLTDTDVDVLVSSDARTGGLRTIFSEPLATYLKERGA